MVTETVEMSCSCEQIIWDKCGRWIWRSVFIADKIWTRQEQASWTVETYSRIKKNYGQRHKMAAITTVRTSTQDDSQRYEFVFWIFQAYIVSAWITMGVLTILVLMWWWSLNYKFTVLLLLFREAVWHAVWLTQGDFSNGHVLVWELSWATTV